ncbi:CheR family methyltransferase [Candidatus Contubernalis alkaliaceticus]|uniref:CheR family methyltransferase n=1 Tax=Candidatus Contubernalis alkaliaceticus TaxID=338645 RepID=UPI001F4C2E82|nr:protein-glutamate O-methyltransferase CheR [Candidatus Contubernalis alkalaceticus]UNC91781.1 protein-glutamate O-methyltransferase CheR [Candidatus Contubernalis alkalaceticus]
MIDSDYEKFKENLYNKIGLDLNQYKERQVKRRITQFMTKHGVSRFSDFYIVLSKDKAVLKRFRDYLTINTSEFFRDIKMYNNLRDNILPNLSKKNGSLKIWSAGCSIGAEPYSLAILLHEAKARSFRIDATDFDENILQTAEAGRYKANVLKNISENLKSKYFEAEGEEYRIKKRIKENIHFKQHNLLSDPYPQGYNLILCRNVFIYFTPETQNALLHKFSKSLKQGGYFILGTSEFVTQTEDFGFRKKAFSIYEKV